MEQTYMKEKPILPLLLSMALPMVLSMMVNSLYNIIDSYFVAKINENAYIYNLYEDSHNKCSYPPLRLLLFRKLIPVTFSSAKQFIFSYLQPYCL